MAIRRIVAYHRPNQCVHRTLHIGAHRYAHYLQGVIGEHLHPAYIISVAQMRITHISLEISILKPFIAHKRPPFPHFPYRPSLKITTAAIIILFRHCQCVSHRPLRLHCTHCDKKQTNNKYLFHVFTFYYFHTLLVIQTYSHNRSYSSSPICFAPSEHCTAHKPKEIITFFS